MNYTQVRRYAFLIAFPFFLALFAWFMAPARAIIGPERGSGATTDYTPPALISAVSLTSDGEKVVITWKDPSDTDFHRVEVLRNDGTGTPVTGIVRGRVQAGVQRYEDLDVIAGQAYLYQFKVMDLDFNTVVSPEYAVKVEAPAPPAETAPSPAPTPSESPPRAGGESGAISPPLQGGDQGVVIRTPEIDGTSETLRVGVFAYGFARVRSLSTEQELARAVASHLDAALPGVFNRLFHQKTATSKSWWYTYVNAYTYGGYTLEEIKQSVRFGGKTVHPTIPAAAWRGSPDYKEFINK